MPETNNFVITNRAVVTNLWHIVSGDTDEALPTDLAKTILPLAKWLQKVSHGETALGDMPGVWLAPEDDPLSLTEALDGQLDQIPIIAVNFPKFIEGRGYSTGYLLRQRFGFRGELRAFGDLGRDNVWQLHRVGFNSIDLRPGTDLDDALEAFNDFPERYQTSVDETVPLFTRRHAVVANA